MKILLRLNYFLIFVSICALGVKLYYKAIDHHANNALEFDCGVSSSMEHVTTHVISNDIIDSFKSKVISIRLEPELCSTTSGVPVITRYHTIIKVRSVNKIKGKYIELETIGSGPVGKIYEIKVYEYDKDLHPTAFSSKPYN